MATNHPSRTPFLERSVNWLTLVIAFVMTFFLQPFLSAATTHSVTAFAAEHYGSGIAFGIGPVWWLLTAAATFLITNLCLKLIFSGATISFLQRAVRR
jgi:hypothetical protein